MNVKMMVAGIGKGKVENKFIDFKGPLFDDATHMFGFGRSHVSFLILLLIFLFVLIFYMANVFEFRIKNKPTVVSHTIFYMDGTNIVAAYARL